MIMIMPRWAATPLSGFEYLYLERTVAVDIFPTKLSAFFSHNSFYRLLTNFWKPDAASPDWKKRFFELLGIEGFFTD
jgi:hypothetical protein